MVSHRLDRSCVLLFLKTKPNIHVSADSFFSLTANVIIAIHFETVQR